MGSKKIIVDTSSATLSEKAGMDQLLQGHHGSLDLLQSSHHMCEVGPMLGHPKMNLKTASERVGTMFQPMFSTELRRHAKYNARNAK